MWGFDSELSRRMEHVCDTKHRGNVVEIETQQRVSMGMLFHHLCTSYLYVTFQNKLLKIHRIEEVLVNQSIDQHSLFCPVIVLKMVISTVSLQSD
jgi:hypothetical protein